MPLCFEQFADSRRRIRLRKNLRFRNRPARQTRPIELRYPVLDGMHDRPSVELARIGHLDVIYK
jgi:hypothetical protein